MHSRVLSEVSASVASRAVARDACHGEGKARKGISVSKEAILIRVRLVENTPKVDDLRGDMTVPSQARSNLISHAR